MLQTSGDSNTQVTLDKADYLPNERQTNSEFEVGAVVPDQSSMAVVLTQYNIVHEEALEEQGLLEDITFEEYCEQNRQKTPIEVDDSIVELVRQTTGIAAANIQISAYTQSMFQAKEPAEPISIQNILMIVLAVLIVALLVFVIFKGTAPVEVTELEPELSVEQLLATTKENQSLDDIEFSDKSEARTMIEKFVDEKPEAVAQLLRNWLNEDWG
jgi:flagellar M-ring protein FliF